jgi:D-3-phosphoglycerate dehydrogenase
MTPRILITDKVHPILVDGLAKKLQGIVEYDTSVDNARLDQIIGDYDGIVINSKIIMDRQRIDRGQRLRFIGRLGSGMEIIDVAYARSKGIGVYNSPEGNRNAVAEHAFGMLLCLLNRLIAADSEVRRFHWDREKNRGTELKGKTVGIIGLGHTGSSFAEKMNGWGVRVLAYDKYKESFPAHLPFVEKTDEVAIQRESDIISFHLPLTEETLYIVTSDWISQCRRGCILINTSRGPIVKTSDVLDALHSGQLGGACLDVFENEKPQSYSTEEEEMYQQLFSLPNVVVTPHIAGWTEESLEGIAEVLLDKICNGTQFPFVSGNEKNQHN